MPKNLKTLFFFLFGCAMAFGQEKFTLSGTITDPDGETIFGATVKLKSVTIAGCYTNEYGFYSITVPAGDYTVEILSDGLKTKEFPLKLDADKVLDLKLEKDKVTELEDVVIKSQRENENVTRAETPTTLDVKEIEKIPVFAGEKDVIKILTLRPGFKSGGDGSAGLYVRGGTSDQNLILLDEAPVYNASHLLGFFSTFNSDAIKDVTAYSGGIPAQYGGRLASTLDIKMREGSDNKYHVSGGLGIIASRLNIEGPIVKEKGSFLISGRRTYADLFLKLTDDYKDNKLYFYDLNLKANYRLNSKNRIYVSGYFGQDKLGLGDDFGINWGNATGTVRLNHLFSPKLFSNTSFVFSNYNYKIAFSSSSSDVEVKSKIRDYNIKQDFTYIPNTKNKIKFGFNSIHHTITPGQIESSDASSNFVKLQDRYAWDNAIYFSNEWKPGTRFAMTYGLRLTSFSLLGEGDFYSYNDKGLVTDTTHYGAGEFVKTYFNLEPRLSMSYMLDENSSLKFSYTRTTQNLHLISNSTASTPTDLWIPSSENVKPEIADQFSLGYFRNFKDNKYEFSAEAYYKSMQNQIDYRDGASTIANDKIEGELLFGIGRAYGIEFLLKKKYGRFTGWLGYTLSRTEKQIDGINGGDWYAARQDKTHDISVVGIYDINEKLSFSASWVYSTGNAVTFPSGKYYLDGNVQWLYTERNGYRMPAYHRLDLGLTWYRKKTDKFESSWNFSIYNAYGRENAWTITFRENEDNPAKTEAVQTALFKWIPSVTYNFKF